MASGGGWYGVAGYGHQGKDNSTMMAYAFSDDVEDMGLYRAGTPAPAGFYTRVDSISDAVVELREGDVLPASCDGHVALYRRAGFTGAMISDTLQSLEA